MQATVILYLSYLCFACHLFSWILSHLWCNYFFQLTLIISSIPIYISFLAGVLTSPIFSTAWHQTQYILFFFLNTCSSSGFCISINNIIIPLPNMVICSFTISFIYLMHIDMLLLSIRQFAAFWGVMVNKLDILFLQLMLLGVEDRFKINWQNNYEL